MHTHTFVSGQNTLAGSGKPRSVCRECNVKKYYFLSTRCHSSLPLFSQKAASRLLDGSLVLWYALPDTGEYVLLEKRLCAARSDKQMRESGKLSPHRVRNSFRWGGRAEEGTIDSENCHLRLILCPPPSPSVLFFFLSIPLAPEGGIP